MNGEDAYRLKLLLPLPEHDEPASTLQAGQAEQESELAELQPEAGAGPMYGPQEQRERGLLQSERDS